MLFAACRVAPATDASAPPQVIWDTGKEQPPVVKAFESGLFTAPVRVHNSTISTL